MSVALGIALLWIGAGYIGYPAVLWLLRRISPREVQRGEVSPSVSVIIAVHDGEAELASKLDQTLALDYGGPMEVLVASDASSDRTEEIARSYADRGVRLVCLPERGGKEAAQAAGIEQASGEILVFTDVGVRLEPNTLRELVKPFHDRSVGCVSSEDLVESGGGEGSYVRYEMALRSLESRATTLVGLSGSCFAVRAELAHPWPVDLASDFRCALEAARRGLRSVSEPAARARVRAVEEASAEWARKVRTVRRGLAVLAAYRDLLHPRHGRTALSLWGHKVLRFTSPFALILLLVASLLAAPESRLAAWLLAGQGAGYGLALAAWAWPSLQRFALARVALFFVLVNASMLVAWLLHWRGQRTVAWQPTAR